MLKAIRMALRYSDVLPIAIDLVKEIEISVRDDGTISKDERSKLLKRFWNLVRAVQAPKKPNKT